MIVHRAGDDYIHSVRSVRMYAIYYLDEARSLVTGFAEVIYSNYQV